MSLVKAGNRYFYNNTSGAVYPWSPDLERVKGLTLFTPSTTGEFSIGMTLAGTAEDVAPAPKPQKPRTAEQEAAAELAKQAAADKVAADKAEADALLATQEADAAQAKADEAASVVVPGTDATIPAVNLKPSEFSGE